jgi:SSS family solute:Na+ symporter
LSAALVNWVVIAAYFVLTLWLGERVSRRGGDLDEYFLAGRGMPWWAAALSIVGTETSTLTFVGVPAIAYAGDLTFLQVAMGYVVGRFMVAWWLVPAYFTGHVRTAYEILDERFGPASRRVASSVFLISRALADGVRLFATALVLQVMLPISLLTAMLGVLTVTLVYTVRGGLRAVIWNDAVQLAVYVGGAALALVILIARVPAGLTAMLASIGSADKLRVLEFGWDWSNPYTFWSGLVGGAVLTMATHGTDQMFVQRLLACGDKRSARLAVVASGGLVFAPNVPVRLLPDVAAGRAVHQQRPGVRAVHRRGAADRSCGSGHRRGVCGRDVDAVFVDEFYCVGRYARFHGGGETRSAPGAPHISTGHGRGGSDPRDRRLAGTGVGLSP